MNKTEFDTSRDWAALALEGIGMCVDEGYVYVGKGKGCGGLPFDYRHIAKLESDRTLDCTGWTGSHSRFDYFVILEEWEKVTGLNYQKVTKKEMKYPIYAKHKEKQFIVKFDDLTSGTVVKEGANDYKIGETCSCWITCEDENEWEILPDYEENTEPDAKAGVAGSAAVGGLPPSFCIKIKSPIQSAAIQEHLFELGYSWQCDKNTIVYTDAPYLFGTIKDKLKYITRGNSNYGNPEITPAQLFSFERETIKEIPIKFDRYEGLITAEKVTMGCQQMTMENFKRLEKEAADYRAGRQFSDMIHDSYNSYSDIKVDLNGITFIVGGEENKMTFADFDQLAEQVKKIN